MCVASVLPAVPAQAAADAQHAWEATPVATRADYLERIAARILERMQEFAATESRDCGKPLALARGMDIARTIDNFRFFARRIVNDQTECHQMTDAINYAQRSAVGVSVLITPWNLPLYLLSWKVAPALACGNTVVCKPSEFTPLTASLLASVCAEVGLPRGVFNLVHGLGAWGGRANASLALISLRSARLL
jgi:aminomuconate-semialdehyde/2-hydroxymuconate-6-semialdehyde dehydrogenase